MRKTYSEQREKELDSISFRRRGEVRGIGRRIRRVSKIFQEEAASINMSPLERRRRGIMLNEEKS